MNAGFSVGVDIGGTFTDFVLRNTLTGAIYLHKSLTTPDDPSRSVVDGLRQLLQRAETSAAELSLAVHGTTLIANSLIERKGAITALVTTGGHHDVLEIGTELRYDSYDLYIDKPEPLVPRPLRFGVSERLDYRGAVVRPLEEHELEGVVDAIGDAGVESVAICFLHAFRNPDHELRAAELLERRLDGVSVSVSSKVAPEIREYQRMSTTVANAYVKPLTERYLGRLEQSLRDLGYRSDLHLMLSSGGITTAGIAADYPIQLLESGPAGGVLCANFVGTLLGRDELISFDMGGTTAKMAYIADGAPLLARAFEVARVSRFRMGSGLPVQVPVIEMIEIGAGGGSVAYKDPLGLLKVGPISAGADPGPACYGFGGEQPTVTDANLLLGYLAADSFLGGEMRLDPNRAETAMRRHVAEPLGLGVVEAARGIFDVVNENMISATKVHVAEKGKDPRRASLVAFGGAGPIHAHALALALNMKEVVCPLRAGVASALGFLTAPIAFDFAQSVATLLHELTAESLRATIEAMERRGAETLAGAGIEPGAVSFRRSADMRFVGQGHEIEVPLPGGHVDNRYMAALEDHFHDRYQALYGQRHSDVRIEFITCRVTASGPDPELRIPEIEASEHTLEDARKGSRPVYFKPGGFADTAVYDRYTLPPAATIAGPAVIEERESTVVIPPEMRGSVDRYGNLVLQQVAKGTR